MLHELPLTITLIGEGDQRVPHQMDSLVILRFAQYFDFLKHSQAERRAAIELRDAATPAFEGHLDSIKVSKGAVELLQKVLESPMDHLKAKIKSQGERSEFDVKEQFVNTDTTQSAILSLEDACVAILGGNTTAGDPTEAE